MPENLKNKIKKPEQYLDYFHFLHKMYKTENF